MISMKPPWDSLPADSVALLGIPDDESSSFMQGPALAPPLIREALHSPANHLVTELGIDLATSDRLVDVGDLEFDEATNRRDHIRENLERLLDRRARPLLLGGDHAITYPIVQALARTYSDLTILHLDAHTDLYDELDGNRYSHGCPMARIMEEGLVRRLLQVGIRTLTPHHREQIERFGVEVIEMRHWRPDVDLNLAGPVYLSLDLDVLEPGIAPGIAHYEPGGMTTREVLNLILGIAVPIVGADIVEYNPRRDVGTITAAVAARFVKEIAGKMLALPD